MDISLALSKCKDIAVEGDASTAIDTYFIVKTSTILTAANSF